MIQFEENPWVDGRMEKSMEEQTEVQMEIIIQDPSGYHQGSNNRVNELQKRKCRLVYGNNKHCFMNTEKTSKNFFTSKILKNC